MTEEMGTPVRDGEAAGESGAALTPALVREVAEKVSALWLQDVRIERERLGMQRTRPNPGRKHGQRRR